MPQVYYKDGVLGRRSDLDLRLDFLVDLASYYIREHNGLYLVITDIFRDNPESPHSDYRAVDLRIKPLTLALWEEFSDWVEARFEYGRGRRCVVVGRHDPKGRHDDHVHLQVPPPFQRERIKLCS